MADLRTLNKKVAAYLTKQQTAAGNFISLASADPNIFKEAVVHPTGFSNSLITAALAAIPECETVCNRVSQRILAEKHDDWSWNYWLKGCEKATSQPFPNDLDDTACALAALHAVQPSLTNGAALGHFASHLISHEVASGGPYTTWLVPKKSTAVWLDVDIAVNANIAFCLKQQAVNMPALDAYFSQAILQNKLMSPYYCGKVPVLYFISRAYSGAAMPTLQKHIVNELELSVDQDNPLDLALLLSAGCRAGVALSHLLPAHERILELLLEDHWVAHALYYEPPVDGEQRFAGSDALTTALCLEALNNYNLLSVAQQSEVSAASNRASRVLTAASSMEKRYQLILRQLRGSPATAEVSKIATVVDRAYRTKVDRIVLENLNSASLNGWAAYTLTDAIIDGESDPSELPLATYYLRHSLHYFRTAVPAHSEYQLLVKRTLDSVDRANDWEIRHTRPPLNGQILTIKKLPDYGNLRQLAARSIGHSLAPLGVLVAGGYDIASPQINNLKEFIYHYLIARQLNDDAHDWLEDLGRGQLSAVVVRLLHDHYGDGRFPLTIDLDQESNGLAQTFWQQTILSTADLIENHIAKALASFHGDQALAEPDLVFRWLKPLEQSVDMVRQKHAYTRKFMQTYLGGRSIL